MKKIVLFAVACLCVNGLFCSCMGCGSSNEEEKRENLAPKDYREACRNYDFDTAHKILGELHSAFTEGSLADDKYYEAFDYIYKAEVQYLMSQYDEDELRGKILYLLEEIPVEGIKAPEGRGEYTIDSRYYEYRDWAVHYNRLCSSILALSINQKFHEVAQMVLLQFIDNIDIKQEQEWKHGYGYDMYSEVKYISIDRDAAQSKYDEAVSLGIFD